MYISKLAIPIKNPVHLSLKYIAMPDDYFFREKLIVLYEYENYIFARLHNGTAEIWLLLAEFTCHTLDELKRTRQILRPTYMPNDVSLPCIALLQDLELELATHTFDKAYGHALQYVKKIDIEHAAAYMNVANYDGEDDPCVSASMHYIENTYANERTLFVAGIETKSFATITESEYYAQSIWPQSVGQLYLLLYVYYEMDNVCLSEQMMPKLLCNLWASTKALCTNYNPNLYKSKQF